MATRDNDRPDPHRDDLDPDRIIGEAWPTDGPYYYQRTVMAARAAGELVRYLNYATRAASGLPEPAAVYQVIGAVRVLLDRLPQLLVQIGQRVTALAATPGAALTGPVHPADPTDPAVAAQTVRGALVTVAHWDLPGTSERLSIAHTQAGRLYLNDPDDCPDDAEEGR